MGTVITGTYVQHADDLARDISNAILEWERRNPGRKVKALAFNLRDSTIEETLAPHAYVSSRIEDNSETG